MNGLFEIKSDTGVITIMSDIDREDLLGVGAAVELTVKVTNVPHLYYPINTIRTVGVDASFYI